MPPAMLRNLNANSRDSRAPGRCLRAAIGDPVMAQKQRLPVAHAEEAEKDFVTRVFGKVFGHELLKEAEPMGLKRLSEDAIKELYQATTDTWAEPLSTDNAEMALIRPMLAQTSIEGVPLRLAYDAEQDGWTPEAFHNAVNTFGAAVVIAETTGGAILGGYNPSGWIGLGEDRDSMAAFLFAWPDGDTSQRPLKLPKVGGAAQAVLDRPDAGPVFGPDGLKVPLIAPDTKRVFSKLGSYYAKPENGARNLFAAGEEAKRGKGTELVWLRTYVAAGGPEQLELDGIIWKTSKASDT